MTATNKNQPDGNLGGEPDVNQSAEPPDTLSLDERFEILKNERRRIVLRYLNGTDEMVKLDSLADHVTAVENDTDISAITSSERKRVYVGLYQFHLPKMAKMGVIEYDQDRGNISLTEAGRQLYQEHENQEQPDSSSHRPYLAVGAFGIVALLGTLLTQAWIAGVGLFAVQTTLLILLYLIYRR